MLSLLSEFRDIQLLDFPLSVSADTTPTSATAFTQGDWYYLTGTGVSIVRVPNGTYPTFAFPIWSKQGEYSTQGLVQVSVIFGGGFLADTDRYDTTQAYTLNMALTVTNGLLTPVGQTGGTIHGYVIRTPGNNSGNLRFYRHV
jgi:hypothetical protein